MPKRPTKANESGHRSTLHGGYAHPNFEKGTGTTSFLFGDDDRPDRSSGGCSQTRLLPTYTTYSAIQRFKLAGRHARRAGHSRRWLRSGETIALGARRRRAEAGVPWADHRATHLGCQKHHGVSYQAANKGLQTFLALAGLGRGTAGPIEDLEHPSAFHHELIRRVRIGL